MRKTVLFCLLLGIMVGVTACGGSSSGSTTVEAAKPAPETTVAETTVSETTVDEMTVPETTPAETEVSETEAQSPYYFKDMEVVMKDYTITITDWKIIPAGKEGNKYGKAPVIAFWYDTTNTSGKDINPMTAWITIMSAVQDNDPNAINKLNVASHPDSKYLDNQMATIKKDGTVTNAMAYELTDEITPVELTASNGLLGDDIGSMTFDVASGEVSNGSNAAIGTIENTEKVAPSFSDNVIVTKDYTIEILDYKVIPVGEEGNKYGDGPVIAFWYNTTNTSGKDINPMNAWLYTVTVVQDNDPNVVNKLSVAALPDSRFLDSQMQSIKAGGTVENAMAYELTDTETPLELTAMESLFGPELGTQIFELK